jgi:hypothetical protein
MHLIERIKTNKTPQNEVSSLKSNKRGYPLELRFGWTRKLSTSALSCSKTIKTRLNAPCQTHNSQGAIKKGQLSLSFSFVGSTGSTLNQFDADLRGFYEDLRELYALRDIIKMV